MKTLSARLVVIYALVDPDTNRVRYIGKSSQPDVRYRQHLSKRCRNKAANPHLNAWIDKLAAAGKRPIFRVLQECLPGMVDAVEQEWIAKARLKGWRLCNIEDGGRGGEWDAVARQRLSDIGKVVWERPEYRERHRAATDKRWAEWREENKDRLAARAATKERNRAVWRANMAKAAASPPRTDPRLFESLTPLTRKGTAFVPLTQGKWAMVDLEDWPSINIKRWSAQNKAGYWRAKRNGPKVGGLQTIILLNREIMVATAGTMVRHRDGNQLNCTRANLHTIKQLGGRPMI